MQRNANFECAKKLARETKTNPKRFCAYVHSGKAICEFVGTVERADSNLAPRVKGTVKPLLSFFRSMHRQSQTMFSMSSTGL